MTAQNKPVINGVLILDKNYQKRIQSYINRLTIVSRKEK